jgi:hypothetical protein
MMLAIPIIPEVSFDEEKPIDEQLIEDSNAVKYDLLADENDREFLTTIAGLKWSDLLREQKIRVIQILVANMVYEGVVSFDYQIVFPDEEPRCPLCLEAMNIFDGHFFDDGGQARYWCPRCKKIVTITPMED